MADKVRDMEGLVGKMDLAIMQDDPSVFDKTHSEYETLAKEAAEANINVDEYDRRVGAQITTMISKHPERYQ